MAYRCTTCGGHFESGSLKTGQLQCVQGHSWNFRDGASSESDLSVRQKAKQPSKEVSQYIFEVPGNYRIDARRLEADLSMRPVASSDASVSVDINGSLQDRSTEGSKLFAPRPTYNYASQVVTDRIMPADTFNNSASRT